MEDQDRKAIEIGLRPARRVKEFHIDGAGSQPGGTGSGTAWVKLGTDRQRVEWMDGLTNNQAEYGALIAVLEYVHEGSSVRIFSDSQLIVEQFNRRYAVRDPKLVRLLAKVRRLEQEKELDVELLWIPRGQNLAGKLLERH